MKWRGFLVWQLLVDILALTAMPTPTQVYLGGSDQLHMTKQPSFGVGFGVGFDLTASYGCVYLLNKDRARKLTVVARLR